MDPDLQKISDNYSAMWEESQQDIRIGKNETDPLPLESGSRWGMSIIFRPTEPVLSRLAESAKNIALYSGASQIIYNQKNIHTTILSVDFFHNIVQENDPRAKIYIEIMEIVANRHSRFFHRYEGVTANRMGVLAQGWPIGNSLKVIRDNLREELGRRNMLNGPEKENRRITSHSSLSVFTHSLSNPVGLVDYIEKNRTYDFGQCGVDALELVSYIRTMTDVEVVSHAHVLLHDSR